MEARFVAKRLGEGRDGTWRVYDRQRASYPYVTAELGVVAQDHEREEDAQAESDRLTAVHGGLTRARDAGGAKASTNPKASERSSDSAADGTADLPEKAGALAGV